MGITLRDVVLTYPDGDTRIRALDDVDFTAERGRLSAVTGPSGSGKSSLLAVAGLLTVPDSGQVVLDGDDLTGATRSQRTALRRDRLGFVFQQSNLLPSLTATEQLLAVTHLRGESVRKHRDRARDLLTDLGLGTHLDRRPHQLSGGQRQRVAIARGLMNDPAVLLVDEPTSALDEARGRQVVGLLADLAHDRNVAVVMVTHDLGTLDLVDEVHEMHSGKLTTGSAVGTAAE